MLNMSLLNPLENGVFFQIKLKLLNVNATATIAITAINSLYVILFKYSGFINGFSINATNTKIAVYITTSITIFANTKIGCDLV